MNPDVLALAQLFLVIGMFTGGMIGIAWVAKVAFRKPRPSAKTLPPVVDEARFARLENAVEAIAQEVERIGEAQRFTTKLLAERATERAHERIADRITTPRP